MVRLRRKVLAATRLTAAFQSGTGGSQRSAMPGTGYTGWLRTGSDLQIWKTDVSVCFGGGQLETILILVSHSLFSLVHNPCDLALYFKVCPGARRQSTSAGALRWQRRGCRLAVAG